MLLTLSPDATVEKKGRWLLLNGARWGFVFASDDGENFIIRHCRRIGVLAKEKGFYVPHALVKLPILFEVRVGNGTHAHYIYRPKGEHRLIKNGGDIFISLASMEVHLDAAHLVRPRE